MQVESELHLSCPLLERAAAQHSNGTTCSWDVEIDWLAETAKPQ